VVSRYPIILAAGPLFALLIRPGLLDPQKPPISRFLTSFHEARPRRVLWHERSLGRRPASAFIGTAVGTTLLHRAACQTLPLTSLPPTRWLFRRSGLKTSP
jgi:hypothetical protein